MVPRQQKGIGATTVRAPRIFVGVRSIGRDLEGALLDRTLADNPMLTGKPWIRYYGGSPIRIPGDLAVGTLCVIDRCPRKLTVEQLEMLRDLADNVESEMATLMSVSDMRVVAQGPFHRLPDAR